MGNEITDETREESHEMILATASKRRVIILEILASNEMTANEIAEVLFEKGYTPFYERNFAAPRLTELKAEGKIEVVGKKYCERTGRKIAVWRIKNKDEGS